MGKLISSVLNVADLKDIGRGIDRFVRENGANLDCEKILSAAQDKKNKGRLMDIIECEANTIEEFVEYFLEKKKVGKLNESFLNGRLSTLTDLKHLDSTLCSILQKGMGCLGYSVYKHFLPCAGGIGGFIGGVATSLFG